MATTTSGINIDKIKGLQDKIATFKGKVQKKMDSVKTNTKLIQNAVKGTNTEEEMRRYAEVIQADLGGLLSPLDQWYSVLEQTLTLYEQHDKENTVVADSLAEMQKS